LITLQVILTARATQNSFWQIHFTPELRKNLRRLTVTAGVERPKRLASSASGLWPNALSSVWSHIEWLAVRKVAGQKSSE
jgi:hypothetical protein